MVYVAYQFKTKDDYPSFSPETLVAGPWPAGSLLIVALAGRTPFVRKVFEGPWPIGPLIVPVSHEFRSGLLTAVLLSLSAGFSRPPRIRECPGPAASVH